MDKEKIQNVINILTEINSTLEAEQIMNVIIEIVNINGLIVNYKKNEKLIILKLKTIKSILNNLYSLSKKNSESFINIINILKDLDSFKSSLIGSTLLVNETEDYTFVHKKNGKDIVRFTNGDIYEGNIKGDKYDGKGVYNYKNGDRYEGDYKNDKKEGKGIYYFKDGRKEECYCKDDEYVEN